MFTAFVVTQLCIVDSRILHKPLVHAAQWVIFTWPLTTPAYVLWSRRLKGLLVLTMHAIALYFVYYAFALGTWLLIGTQAFDEAEPGLEAEPAPKSLIRNLVIW